MSPFSECVGVLHVALMHHCFGFKQPRAVWGEGMAAG